MNNRRSILELSNDEAKAFFLKSTSYNQVPSLLPVIALFSVIPIIKQLTGFNLNLAMSTLRPNS